MYFSYSYISSIIFHSNSTRFFLSDIILLFIAYAYINFSHSSPRLSESLVQRCTRIVLIKSNWSMPANRSSLSSNRLESTTPDAYMFMESKKVSRDEIFHYAVATNRYWVMDPNRWGMRISYHIWHRKSLLSQKYYLTLHRGYEKNFEETHNFSNKMIDFILDWLWSSKLKRNSFAFPHFNSERWQQDLMTTSN